MKNDTQKLIRHVVYPAILTVLFFINAALPVTVLGCANRGLVALAVALISGVAGLAAAVIGLKERIAGNAESAWWIVSTLVLMIPLVALIRLA